MSDVFLKISSVYEDEPEVKQAVFESTGMVKIVSFNIFFVNVELHCNLNHSCGPDALLRKAFSNSHSRSYSFISSLIVNLGLLKVPQL